MLEDVLSNKAMWHIETCDVLDGLAMLPDGCIQCCVTSPPYFGLRDYGTATWEGGDASCQHKVRSNPRIESSGLAGGKSSTGHQQEGYGSTCERCGARRIDRAIGLEPTPEEYIDAMVRVFREVRRVLRLDGVCFLNLGDTYAGSGKGGNPEGSPWAGFVGNKQRESQARANGRGELGQYKPKDLMMMPARVALALQADGWWLRSEVTWCKRAPMPESVTDRPTSATEKIYLLTKASSYFYDADAVREEHLEPWRGQGQSEQPSPKHLGANPSEALMSYSMKWGKREYNPAGRNLWNYWLLSPEPYAEAHFATFPTSIPRRCIRAGTSEKGCCPAMITKLRVRSDLTPEQRERVERFLKKKQP